MAIDSEDYIVCNSKNWANLFDFLSFVVEKWPNTDYDSLPLLESSFDIFALAFWEYCGCEDRFLRLGAFN